MFKFLFLLILTIQIPFAQKGVWLDTDLMIGLPENAPREVDDAIALMMAMNLKSKIEIVGVSTISNTVYAKKTGIQLLKWFNKTGKTIPVYGGANSAEELGVENEATLALGESLKSEKLTILAIGPLTNIATVIKNHPESLKNIDEIVVCAGRTANYPFSLGIGNLKVWDYNFEYDVKAFEVILESKVKLVLAGFESSESLLLGGADIAFMKNKSQGHTWVYKELVKWQNNYTAVFGLPAFVPWDTTPLGYLTHPQYFKVQKNIPVKINFKQNDANVGPNLGKEKYFLEVSKDFNSPYKVDFVFKTLPGFEEQILEILQK